MFGRFKFLGLNLKTREPSTRYFVQGQGEIRLGRSEFKAQGGEGAVYVKGSSAYKIYSDPKRCIPRAKIDELSVLVHPNIIRPLDLIVDGSNNPVGYSMRNVSKAHALCQLFPKAFRQRNNLTPELTLNLVRHLQTGVAHVHNNGILIVDLNEMNFLVSTDFRELFFIDVDSYQTPSFPATVLMESVRDRHATRFTTESDWFSFAIVSFQMFVGIHPFKGTYPPLQHLADTAKKLDARMKQNISVLHKGVSVPAACLPVTVIPQAYLDWYRAVFEEGKRLPPPDKAHAVVTIAQPQVVSVVQSNSFVVTEFREFDSEIIWHDGVVSVTQQGIYFDGRKYPKPPFDVKLTITPRRRHLIAAYNDGTRLWFHDVTANQIIQTEIDGEEVMLGNGQFYIKQHENIFAVDFIELPNNLLLSLKPVANVMLNATRMFEGVAIQSLLGATYASIPGAGGACYQVHLPELDGKQIVNARLYRNVLVAVIASGGQYVKLIFRFTKDFSSYTILKFNDVATTDIEFTVLDSGVVLCMGDDNDLLVFSSNKDSHTTRIVKDPALRDDVRLFHTGTQALLAKGHKLYKFRLLS